MNTLRLFNLLRAGCGRHGVALCFVVMLLAALMAACGRRDDTGAALRVKTPPHTSAAMPTQGVAATRLPGEPVQSPAAWRLDAVEHELAAFAKIRSFHADTQALPNAWALIGKTNEHEALTFAGTLNGGPYSDRALHTLAKLAYKEGNNYLAYCIWTNLFARTPDRQIQAWYCFYLVRILETMRRHKERIEMCQYVLSAYRGHWLENITLNAAGFSSKSLGRYKEAIDYYRRVQEHDYLSRGLPPGPWFDHDIAECYLSMRDLENALAHVNRGLQYVTDICGEHSYTEELLLKLRERIKQAQVTGMGRK